MPVKTHDEKTTHLIEAVLFDETGDLSLTFWEEHFENVKEFTWYHFTKMNLKNYFGLKLSTSKATSVTEENENVPIPELDEEDVNKYVDLDISIKKKLKLTYQI